MEGWDLCQLYELILDTMSTGERRAPSLLVLKKIRAILDVFTLEKPEFSLAEIRAATSLPTSTVQRLVANLVEEGFLDRNEDCVRVGVRMAYWSAPAMQGAELLEVVKPVLGKLRDELGETTCFYQTSQHYRVCVAMAETRHSLRRAMRVGQILPIHAGSAGKVLLAWDEELAQQVRASELSSLTELTITDQQTLRAAVESTRVDGFAITTGERQSGASGLSAPVFDRQAELLGALTVMGPTLRMPQEVCMQWVDRVVGAADQITRMVGGRYPADP